MVQKWIFALLLLFALITSCEKDNAVDGSSAADITFRNDSGYTFTNDTVGLSDTLRIVMIAAEGTDPLELFVLHVSYDGDPAIGTDTADINVNPYMFDKQVITRSVPGTEKWTFGVIEGDGDRTQRSITLVTQ
ncbi:MAG: hypothetical protein IPO90_09100 [Flavobacteriales bacterium]|nr:hypothetical protein [Flavobacteriales bacterium]